MNHFQVNYSPKCERHTTKALEDNLKQKFYNIKAGEDFFDKRPKALLKKTTPPKIDNWIILKLRTFVKQNIVKKTFKDKAHLRNDVCNMYKFNNKGFIYRIYK